MSKINITIFRWVLQNIRWSSTSNFLTKSNIESCPKAATQYLDLKFTAYFFKISDVPIKYRAKYPLKFYLKFLDKIHKKALQSIDEFQLKFTSGCFVNYFRISILSTKHHAKYTLKFHFKFLDEIHQVVISKICITIFLWVTIKVHCKFLY